MNNIIKNALLNGRLILLFGAGSSRGSKNKLKNDIPLGRELAQILANEIGENFEGEELSDVYSAAKQLLGEKNVAQILERHYKHCSPSSDYIELTKYPFFRIYSLNIDDAFERAIYTQPTDRAFNVRHRHDNVVETDQFFQTLDYIKLNGDINRISNGFIFSAQEYGESSVQEPLWYQELARDFHRYTFLFIGTQLKEPLFFHQISKYKAKNGQSSLKSYLLIPELTPIQKASLEASNIEHLPGTLTNFTSWLKQEFPETLTSKDIIKNTRPELSKESSSDIKNIKLFSNVTPVSRASLALMDNLNTKSKIRNFYKGFKPTWFDIMDGVPAYLYKTSLLYEKHLSKNTPSPLEIYMIYGTAGSGKTTALKQLALLLADEGERNVYFIEEYKENIKELITELDHRNNKPYYLFLDRMVNFSSDLSKLIKSERSNKAIFVSSENPKIWKTRTSEHIESFVKASTDISEITDQDADEILEKIKQYGSWTRLQKMSKKNRKIELLKKSKRQLLIGLIETISGEGYNQIIKKDYQSITCPSEKALLILAGLATTQRALAHETTLTRAMSYLRLNPNVYYVASNMDGIVQYNNGNVSTRHRVYIEKLFRLYVSSEELHTIVSAYIKAFSVYKFPLGRNISSKEFSVYKYLVNSKALKKIFKEDKEKILSIYESYEKTFENEGLYLMQYGLALRSFGEQDLAYEKLSVARQAFPESPHIEHALAQQRIILACKANDETIALALLDEAKSALNSLIQSNISPASGGTDTYPLITLAEGHVKVLDSLGEISQAKVIAKEYHSRINNSPDLRDSFRIKQTLVHLMKYTVSGKWPKTDNEDF